MAKTTVRTKNRHTIKGLQDSTYLLKIIAYLIVGSLWLRIDNTAGSFLPLPVGLVIGIVIASHERFQVDRKIEYALLALAAFIGFWLPIGITIIL